jgi:hypothetical protein
MNLIELLQEPYGGDTDVALFNIGIVLGLIPKDTEFSTKGKDLICANSSLTCLLSKIYYLLVESKAFYVVDESLKSHVLEDLYIAHATVEKDLIFFNKDNLFKGENGELFACVEYATTQRASRNNIPVVPLI